jgi:nicotinamidase-related amidase
MNGSAAEREVLIIIDPQINFCPGVALAVPGGDEIVPTVNRRARDFPHVILTQDWHPPGHRSFARRDSLLEGAGFEPSVPVREPTLNR